MNKRQIGSSLDAVLKAEGTDARHFLDDKGAIAPVRGPAKAMADFHADVIAYATDFDDTGRVTLPRCFKCKKGTVEATTSNGTCARLGRR
jgi:hypothetical protein